MDKELFIKNLQESILKIAEQGYKKSYIVVSYEEYKIRMKNSILPDDTKKIKSKYGKR